MKVNGTLTIICHKCDASNDFFASDADFEIQEVHQRNSGQERNWVAEIEFGCSNCSNMIYGAYEKWEYPIGFGQDVDNITLDGGSTKNTFDFDFNPEE